MLVCLENTKWCHGIFSLQNGPNYTAACLIWWFLNKHTVHGQDKLHILIQQITAYCLECNTSEYPRKSRQGVTAGCRVMKAVLLCVWTCKAALFSSGFLFLNHVSWPWFCEFMTGNKNRDTCPLLLLTTCTWDVADRCDREQTEYVQYL